MSNRKEVLVQLTMISLVVGAIGAVHLVLPQRAKFNFLLPKDNFFVNLLNFSPLHDPLGIIALVMGIIGTIIFAFLLTRTISDTQIHSKD